MEQVRIVLRITKNAGAPPIREILVAIAGGLQGIPVRRKKVIVVIRVKLHENAKLPQIVQTGNPFALGLGRGEGGQQQGGQNGDDGDHHQQFDEGEGAASGFQFFGAHTSTFTSRKCKADCRALVKFDA